jgi:glycerate-2-kinase
MAGAFAHVHGRVRRALVAGPAVPAARLPTGWEVLEPAHPLPDAVSVDAGSVALRLARDSQAEWLVVLLSGGASSMLCAPAGDLGVEDKARTSKALMDAGVPIDGLNGVRKHLSAIKGGRLAVLARRSLTLAISDVHHPVADDPSVIGSGPTVADPTTYAMALRTASAVTDIPARVLRHLERGAAGELPETIKPSDPRLDGAVYSIVGNRHTALTGAGRRAEELGYHVRNVEEPTHGDARTAAEQLIRRAASCPERPLCLLAAGETTVRVTGRGLGGRNQQLVLAALPLLRTPGTAAVIASAGTDGVDGPTDAAGAVGDGETLDRAAALGLDPAAALADNDAYRFFAALGDLIISGPTGTNVGDVQVLLLA